MFADLSSFRFVSFCFYFVFCLCFHSRAFARCQSRCFNIQGGGVSVVFRSVIFCSVSDRNTSVVTLATCMVFLQEDGCDSKQEILSSRAREGIMDETRCVFLCVAPTPCRAASHLLHLLACATNTEDVGWLFLRPWVGLGVDRCRRRVMCCNGSSVLEQTGASVLCCQVSIFLVAFLCIVRLQRIKLMDFFYSTPAPRGVCPVVYVLL